MFMWFKNLYVFAFTRPLEWQSEELEQQLNENHFRPCGQTEMSHFGWVNALGKHGNSLVHQADGHFLICAKKEEKILPAPVIKDMLDEKVAILEAEHGRSATKKEKEQFKEDILFELLPRAFSRYTQTHGYISPKNNLIVINSSSRSKAEDFLALLRKSLGSLPVTSLTPDRAPDEIMTEWLTEVELPNSFVIGQEAELQALGDDGAIIRCKNQDLASDEIKVHLDAEKYVVKLALEWDESISFILADDLSIKRLKFLEVLQEQTDDIPSDDVLAKMDAEFTLMAGELNRFIEELAKLFEINPTDYLEEK